MKKILSLLIVGIFILTMTTPVFAMEPQTETSTNVWYKRFTQVQERRVPLQAEMEQKREDVSDFKADAREKRALIKIAAEGNKALLQTGKATREELAKIYADMKANGTTLDASTLEQLATYRQQVRDIMDELRASKGSIQNYFQANKESLKSLDYSVLESLYADIAEIQSWRNEQLIEINRILGEMLALVQ